LKLTFTKGTNGNYSVKPSRNKFFPKEEKTEPEKMEIDEHNETEDMDFEKLTDLINELN